MHWLDTTILALLGLGAALGAWCGFFWQIARIVTVGMSVYGSILLHDPATQLVRDGLLKGADPRVVRGCAYVAAFLVVYVILYYVMRLVREGIRAARLEGLDCLLGACLGASKMAIVLGVVCLGLVTYKSPATTSIVEKSVVAPAFAEGAEALILMIPEDFKTQFREHLQGLGDMARTLPKAPIPERDTPSETDE